MKLIFHSEMHQILYIHPELDCIQVCLLEGQTFQQGSHWSKQTYSPLVFVAHSVDFFLFYLSKLVLVFGNSPNEAVCLIMHALTQPFSECLARAKLWALKSQRWASNGRRGSLPQPDESFRRNKIESDFYSSICHLSGKNALAGQQLKEVFSNYFYGQWP